MIDDWFRDDWNGGKKPFLQKVKFCKTFEKSFAFFLGHNLTKLRKKADRVRWRMFKIFLNFMELRMRANLKESVKYTVQVCAGYL